MNHSLRRLAIRNRFVLTLINKFYNLKNNHRFQQIITENKKLAIFDYKNLIKPIPYAPTDLVIDNNLYGLSYTLKKYAGLNVNRSLDASIEHGVFFGNLVRKDDRIYLVNSIITFGPRRIKHLKKGNINKTIIPIGPYIHYARPLLTDEQFLQLKSELGKVLLVFPSHGIIGVDLSYNLDDFINEIERIKVDYDNVLVSLYWTDALNTTLVNRYIEKGYKIVTSGHRFDLNFLSRQRSIIELADYTISNNLGTHVGYCIYLGKPHYIFRQKVDSRYKNRMTEKHVVTSRTEDNVNTYESELEEVCSHFDSDIRVITPEQKEIVEEFWGISFIKTPLELQKELAVV